MKFKQIQNHNFKDLEPISWKCIFATCIYCGVRKSYSANNLPRIKSCGCQQFVNINHAEIVHGHTVGGKMTPTYKSWVSMKSRCLKGNSPNYSNYGGRGISIDPRWLDFSMFINDMGERPGGTSIGRIENSKNYCKENCRWETPKQQQRNTRANLIYELNGHKASLAEWAETYSVEYQLLYDRVRRQGWELLDGLTRKTQGRKNA